MLLPCPNGSSIFIYATLHISVIAVSIFKALVLKHLWHMLNFFVLHFGNFIKINRELWGISYFFFIWKKKIGFQQKNMQEP